MKQAIYENDALDTLNKPFSACWMVFSPHGDTNLIVGDTEKVREYWNSLDDFDFQWYVFDSEEEMEAGIQTITKEPAPCMGWVLYQIEDCVCGDYPNWKKGKELGISSQ